MGSAILAVKVSPGLLVSVPTGSIINTVRLVPDGTLTTSGGSTAFGAGGSAGVFATAARVEAEVSDAVTAFTPVGEAGARAGAGAGRLVGFGSAGSGAASC